jgi:hypothetical protein
VGGRLGRFLGFKIIRLELEYKGVRSGTMDLGDFMICLGKKGRQKLHSTCGFKSKSLLEVKKKKERWKETIICCSDTLIPIMRDERSNAYFL